MGGRLVHRNVEMDRTWTRPYAYTIVKEQKIKTANSGFHWWKLKCLWVQIKTKVLMNKQAKAPNYKATAIPTTKFNIPEHQFTHFPIILLS